MPGKQAKILTSTQARSVARHLVEETQDPERNLVMFLLSYRAGLRASEIVGVTWDMVLDSEGEVQDFVELRDSVSKMGSGRVIPLHSELKEALVRLREHPKYEWRERDCTVILTMRGGPMTAHSAVCWFKRLYETLGIKGASSHSGRRTLATEAARNLSAVGASLRDLQDILGHKHLSTTQRYVEVSSKAKRGLIDSL